MAAAHATPLDLCHPATGDTVALVPVRVVQDPDDATSAPMLLAYVPTGGGVVGAAEPEHARGGRREAAVALATKWLSELGLAPEAHFLAAEVDAFGNGFDVQAARVSVIAAPAHGAPAGGFARTATELRDEPGRGAWATLDALAEDSTSPQGQARYRVAAVALARTDSYIRPTHDGPRFMRVGARTAADTNTSATPTASGGPNLQQCCAAADAGCRELNPFAPDRP